MRSLLAVLTSVAVVGVLAIDSASNPCHWHNLVEICTESERLLVVVYCVGDVVATQTPSLLCWSVGELVLSAARPHPVLPAVVCVHKLACVFGALPPSHRVPDREALSAPGAPPSGLQKGYLFLEFYLDIVPVHGGE